MSNLVIVAIPTEDDYVRKLSSEKVPHLTILFLGDVLKVQNLSSIMGYLEHAASRSLDRFGLDVDRRGTLGEDEADVLFFSKTKWSGYPELIDFRNFLLKEPNIKMAYDTTTQYEEYTPHLTLGYPPTPAKEDDRDYPGIHYVQFDKVALWIDDYDGPEFRLNTPEWDMEIAQTGMERVDAILHYGVKGMRWGQRNSNRSTPSKAEIQGARARTSEKQLAIKAQTAKAKKTKGRAAPAEFRKAADMHVELLRSPDRATAMRLTKGEKWIAAALLATPVVNAPTAGVIAARVATRKATERRIKKDAS